MTKTELIAELAKLIGGDPETVHPIADQLLLEFINDEAVKSAYDAVKKWYS